MYPLRYWRTPHFFLWTHRLGSPFAPPAQPLFRLSSQARFTLCTSYATRAPSIFPFGLTVLPSYYSLFVNPPSPFGLSKQIPLLFVSPPSQNQSLHVPHHSLTNFFLFSFLPHAVSQSSLTHAFHFLTHLRLLSLSFNFTHVVLFSR